jgi:F0F1-type ATP synthase membrane subunit b/b'
MILVTRNWRMYFIGLAVSIGIFLVVYFTAIQPSVNTANQAVKSGLQQTQQALNQAQKQINSATGQANSAAGQASSAAGSAGSISKTVNKQLSKAATLAKCVATAGTDVTKVTACQTKYGG